MSETITVYLTVTATPAAPRLELVIPKDVSASELRKSVADKTKIPLAKLRLITRGKLIGDKSSVEEFKLQDGHVLHCMGKPEGASAAVPEASAPSPGTIAGSSVTIQPQTTASTPAAVSSSNPLQTAFATMKSSNPPQTYITAVTTLEKVLSNITSNPMEEKYRKVKKMNAAFQKRLGGVAGGDDAMKAAGFVTEMDNAEEVYIMHASAEQWPQLMAAKATVEAAVREAKAAASAPPPNAAAAGMLNFGAMPGMGTGMNPGMMGPDMQSAAAQMMQNPVRLFAFFLFPITWLTVLTSLLFLNSTLKSKGYASEHVAGNCQFFAGADLNFEMLNRRLTRF